jgi:hypothetical protein
MPNPKSNFRKKRKKAAKQPASPPVDRLNRDAIAIDLQEFGDSVETITEFLEEIAQARGQMRQIYFKALGGLVYRWRIASQAAIEVLVEET